MEISWLAIINLDAGIPLSIHQQQRLMGKLKYELNAEVVVTRNPLHAAEVIHAARDKTAIAVFGGDGTIAEVVNQMDLNAQQLLPLSGGTGNGLARDLGLTTLENCFGAVRNNHKRSIDILHVTFQTLQGGCSRLAVSTVAMGYAADTVVIAKRLFRPFGSLRYSFAMVMRALQTHTFELSIQADGNRIHHPQVATVIINNTKHMGNFNMFRKANLYDEKMDVFLTNGRDGSQIFRLFADLVRNRSFTPDVEFKTQELSLHMNTPIPLMIDGDIWKDVTEVNFKIPPSKLMCFTGNI